MYCLHCGDCCNRMCPYGINPCPKVIQKDTFFFCSDYENRPKECWKHDFPSRFCPVGISVLSLHSLEEIRDRINEGWQILKEGGINNG